MKAMYRVRLKLLMAGVGLCLFVLSLAPAGASSANISHSYHSLASIPNGSIVSLDPLHTDYVEAASTGNGLRLLGVAVASDDSLLAVDPTVGAIQVATSGTATTLVSTLGGNINVGDQVSVSPFNGIGMKATPGAHIIGLAQTSFTADSGSGISQSVTDKNGKTKQIEIGYVRLTIGVGTSATAGDTSLNSLQKFGKSLTGHVVSTTRVIISLVVAFVALISLIVLIYASIYGSIISIGRNPLAKYAVFRTLSSVLGMAVLTAVIATLTIFFLLR